MKKLLFVMSFVVMMAGCQNDTGLPREMDFNQNWKFSLGDVDQAENISFDDTDWRSLNLPHDWSVEASFDKEKEGATAYLPGGIGWYRRHFSIPLERADQLTYICFDGIYNNTDIWINGKFLGNHPYGYSPFNYEITSYLNTDGQENVLAVRVDRSRYADSRWYTGSGIYRSVKLIRTNKLHIPMWGTYLTAPDVSEKNASVRMEVAVKNAADKESAFVLSTIICDQHGKQVAQDDKEQTVPGHDRQTFVQSLSITNPILWDIENPNMYKAVSYIKQNGRVVDKYVTPFGIRTIKFDPDEGFFLNGKNMLIKGVCLHHDGGLVGAAVPKGVWRRRLEKLKEAGCNAIRISHNPGSEEFLNLCDEMGLLVQNEFFDEWDFPKDKRLNMKEKSVDYITRGYSEHFQQWAERDLKSTMLRDRNHPSIIQWSIGNEIEWTYPRYKHATGYFDAQWSGNYFWTPPHILPEEVKKRYDESKADQYVLAETAQKLSNWTKDMDMTRPVTANCILPSASHVTGYADALDVVGYSYRRVVYDYGHKHFPDTVIMGTENLVQWHEWKAVIERPFISGLFLWTGIDYMGEANGKWPVKGTASGMLDLAGFEKPSWHMMKTLWNEDPHIYMTTQNIEKSIYKIDESTKDVVEKKPGAWKRALWTWHDINEHWNYTEEALIAVEVYSNCEQVELYLNDRSLGTKKLSDFEDRIYKWAVPYVPGKLVAKGYSGDKIVATELVTASEPDAVALSVDKKSMRADSKDVVHIIAQLVDKHSNPVKANESEIAFVVQGNCRILGVDNGAAGNVQDFQSNTITTHKGRSLLIIQSKREKGDVVITAKSDKLKDGSVKVIID